MKVHWYANDRDFVRDFAKDAAMEVRRFGAYLTADVAEEFEKRLIQGTPFARKANTGKRYGHAPGLMKRSWSRIAIVAAEGRAWGIGNRAAHANVINRGRKPNKNGYWVRVSTVFGRPVSGGRYWMPKGGRMMGSLQAPKGVIGPAWRSLRRQEEALTKRAIAQTEAA